MLAFDQDRLLSMSAFEAAVTLRRFRRLNPTYDDHQLVETIRTVRSDFYPNDFEAGLALERLVDEQLDGTVQAPYFKAIIESIIEHCKPLWVRLAPGGREHVLRAVSTNGVQCFRGAGLLDAPPDTSTSQWWDALAAKIRGEREARLLEQGREAERLSFESECDRVRSLGITKEPRWVAVEDNNAGFDILSYDLGDPQPVNRLIEVKSSTHQPPRIIVTRREWKAALDYGASYVFHIWSFPQKTFVERTAVSLSGHVPIDQGQGEWLRAEIEIS